MQVQVTARKDIKTSNNFTVAKAGQRGRVLSDVAFPYDKTNLGKVLVQFHGRSRAYWCLPEDLSAPSKVDLTALAAKPQQSEDGSLKFPSKSSSTGKYHFGHNLKLCRKARKLSQTALSQTMTEKGLKISQATVCYRENCPHSPNGRFINAAAEALGVPAFVFFIPITQLEAFDTASAFLQNLSSCVNEYVRQ